MIARRRRSADLLHIATLIHQEARAQLAIVVPALDQHRRTRRDRRAAAADIDQGAAASVLDHEVVAIHRRDAAAYRHHPVPGGDAGDRGRHGRCHLHGRPRQRHGTGTAGCAEREQGGGAETEPLAAVQVGNSHTHLHIPSLLVEVLVTGAAATPLNRAVQFRFNPQA